MTSLESLLDFAHPLQQQHVKGDCVSGSMSATVAVRAECDDKAGMVRTAIANPPYVVRLQVGGSICSSERRGIAITLAVAVGSCEYIISDVSAALIEISGLIALPWLSHPGRFVGQALQRFQIYVQINCGLLDLFLNSVQCSQFEDNCVALLLLPVRSHLDVVRFVDHVSDEPNSLFFDSFEKQDRPAILGMCLDGKIPLVHLHMPDLALAEVLESAIFAPAVVVTVLFAAVPSDDEDWAFGPVLVVRGDNSTPPRSIENRVNVSDAVVSAPYLKSIAHWCPLLPKCGGSKLHAEFTTSGFAARESSPAKSAEYCAPYRTQEVAAA